MKLSIGIPTYGRDEVLINTIKSLLNLKVGADEIIIVDQTQTHDLDTLHQLEEFERRNEIRWIKIQFPSITRAMNIILRKARGTRVLFLDDDIIPEQDLVTVHRQYASESCHLIVAGRVLQPWHQGMPDKKDSPFLFNSLEPREVSSFMAGNVSMPRGLAISLGGFDTNFVRVAYHFEAEFSYRWRMNGYKIYYEPNALIHHLKSERGGTRTYGKHLTTTRPDHSVGRYYYNLRTNSPKEALLKSFKDFIESILTKHHLRNPFWIPLTLIAELRGFIWALLLNKSGNGQINGEDTNILIVASHPIQYTTPIYKVLSESSGCKTKILYLTIPDKRSLSLGFDKGIQWDIPLLEGYEYECTKSECGKGLAHGFMGIKLRSPFSDLAEATRTFKPDVVLFTGWHFFGMLQIFCALIMGNIPIILRMDSNGKKERSRVNRWVYRKLLSYVKLGLVVGLENRDFCLSLGMNSKQIVLCPHVVDNEFFSLRAKIANSNKDVIRTRWNIPENSYCFIFAGKLQDKKRPFDILFALKRVYQILGNEIFMLMVGSGNLEADCVSYASSMKLPVTFAGFLNQTVIPEAYGISDCIILPSGDDETWGLVINEAMSCGIPAIVSDKVGCARDLVLDGKTGYSYQCGDINKLSELMHYLATNRLLSKEMGKNAKALIFEKYNLNQAVNGIIKGVSLING